MKLEKIDPTKLYMCLMGYSNATVTRPAGSTYRGTDEEVQRNPKFYIESPCSEQERIDALRERFPGIDASNRLFK